MRENQNFGRFHNVAPLDRRLPEDDPRFDVGHQALETSSEAVRARGLGCKGPITSEERLPASKPTCPWLSKSFLADWTLPLVFSSGGIAWRFPLSLTHTQHCFAAWVAPRRNRQSVDIVSSTPVTAFKWMLGTPFPTKSLSRAHCSLDL